MPPREVGCLKRPIVIAVAVLLILVAGGLLWNGRASSSASYQTAAISRGPLTQAVTATGTLNPVVNVQVGSQISGRVLKLFADFNSTVKAGEVIAQIDPAVYAANVAQAEGELANAHRRHAVQQRDETCARGGTTLRNINAQVASASDLAPAQQQIIELLRQRHNVREGRDDDFTVRTQEEIAETATATSRVMTLLLGTIASVSLIVGGIGIMNIMLVSVTERTREIGVRLAVGAHGRDILTQFLIEAVALSSIGGMIGIILGLGTSQVLSRVADWPTLISISSIVVSFLFSAAVGVFFGFYPARQAAALDPIEALRYE